MDAIVAVAWVFVLTAIPAIGVPVDPPLRVGFSLIDGVRISGEMTQWNHEGIDGSFGRRRWTELKADDAWRLHRRVMDEASTADWVNLGRIMLLLADSRDRAEQAFRQALKLDPGVAERIDEVRRQCAEATSPPAIGSRAPSDETLRSLSPEAGPWPPDPWPPMTSDERAAAVDALKAEAAEMYRTAVPAAEIPAPIESDRILLYASAPRIEAAEWTWHLEQACTQLAGALGLPGVENLFHGKAVVFVLADDEAMQRMEAEVFHQVIPQSTNGIVHYRGPNAFLVFHHDDQQHEFADVLAHHGAIAMLSRFASARRLPPWANEGLAAHVASQVLTRSEAQRRRSRAGLGFLREAGAPLDVLLDSRYEDESWANRAEVVAAVGEQLVRLMIRERPEAFAAWVRAVKGGKEWREALKDDYGVNAGRLFDTALAHYRVND